MLQPKSPSTVPTNCATQHFGDQTDPLSGYKHPVVNNGLYAAHNMDILSPPILQTSSFYIRSAMQTSLLGALEPLSIHNTDGQSTPAVSASVVGHKTMICISVYPAAPAELHIDHIADSSFIPTGLFRETPPHSSNGQIVNWTTHVHL